MKLQSLSVYSYAALWARSLSLVEVIHVIIGLHETLSNKLH